MQSREKQPDLLYIKQRRTVAPTCGSPQFYSLSDLLDDFVLAYENHFADQVDEGDEQTALEDEFEQLYGFIKDWQDKACDKMVKIEQSRMRL